MKFKEAIPVSKPVIGMLHLRGDSRVPMLERALREIDAYLANGVDALLVENYFGDVRDCETVLRHLAAHDPGAPYGVNILGNHVCAFELAAEHGARFIQIDSVCGHLPPIQDAAFGERLDNLRAHGGPAVLGGVRFKYQPVRSGRSLADDLALGRCRCDAIVVTGEGTGEPTPVGKVVEFRRILGDFPLIVGAGLTADTIGPSLAIADGAIVGSWFKTGHRDTGEVSGVFVRRFMERAHPV